MKTKIIGLVGRKRSGKDATFKIIQELGVNAERVAFADELKHEVAIACDVEKAFIESHKDQFRLGLQWWGSEFRRGLFGENYWIERACRKILPLEILCDLIVITDVRFPNEAEFVHKLGGTVVHIDRWPGLWAWIKRKLSWEHQSEQVERIPADYVIKNNGTLDDLKTKVMHLLDDLDIGTDHVESQSYRTHQITARA